MPKKENWVELLSTTADYEAHLILGLLQANGIPAQSKSYRVSQFPFDIGHIGEIKIMVQEDDLKEAEEILKNSDENLGQEGQTGNKKGSQT